MVQGHSDQAIEVPWSNQTKFRTSSSLLALSVIARLFASEAAKCYSSTGVAGMLSESE